MRVRGEWFGEGSVGAQSSASRQYVPVEPKAHINPLTYFSTFAEEPNDGRVRGRARMSLSHRACHYNARRWSVCYHCGQINSYWYRLWSSVRRACHISFASIRFNKSHVYRIRICPFPSARSLVHSSQRLKQEIVFFFRLTRMSIRTVNKRCKLCYIMRHNLRAECIRQVAPRAINNFELLFLLNPQTDACISFRRPSGFFYIIKIFICLRKHFGAHVWDDSDEAVRVYLVYPIAREKKKTRRRYHICRVDFSWRYYTALISPWITAGGDDHDDINISRVSDLFVWI